MSESDMQKRLLTYLSDKSIQNTESYLKRGRRFSQSETPELKNLWIENFRIWTAEVTNSEARITTDDIESELSLRNEQPPYDQIQAELDQFTAGLNKSMLDLPFSRIQEIDEDILDNLEKFEKESENFN